LEPHTLWSATRFGNFAASSPVHGYGDAAQSPCGPHSALRTPNLRQLLNLVDQQRSVDSLRVYFGTDLPPGTPPRYTGGRFELLSGGGDHPVSRTGLPPTTRRRELLGVRVSAEISWAPRG